MANGVTSTTVSSASTVDELIGNKSGSTVRIGVGELTQQLMADPSFVTGDSITKQTWSELSAVAGTRDGQRGYAAADAGTHSDPVVGGTVPNQGIFGWVAAAPGWQWLSDNDVDVLSGRVDTVETDLAAKAETVALAAEVANRTSLIDGSESQEPLAAQTDLDGYEIGVVGSGDMAGIRRSLGIEEAAGIGDVDGYSVVVADGPLAQVLSDRDATVSFQLSDDDGYQLEIRTGGDDQALYGARDAANLAASAAVRQQRLSQDIAGLFWERTGVFVYGQSLGYGTEGWPALSKTQDLSNLMIGGSVRPGASPSSGSFTPVGSLAFVSHVAVVQSASTLAVLSDAAVAALSPGDGAYGETFLEGALNGLKRRWNDHKAVSDDTDRVLVAAAAGYPSKTVAELSDGGVYFDELLDRLDAMKGLADAAGKTSGTAVLIYAQGEHDYGSTSVSAWKASFVDDVYTPFAGALSATFGQEVRPIVLFSGVSPDARSYRSGGATQVSIDQAQNELVQEYDNFFMAGPNYHVTDKGIHLSSNGYRWVGNHIAKVLTRLLVDRRAWRPLEPRWDAPGGAVFRAGNVISIDMMVPEPPLAWGTPYVGRTATDYVQKGFRVEDDLGVVGFKVRLVLSTIVELTLERETVGAVYVTYAGKADFGGQGCLRDSDPWVSGDAYAYETDAGFYADEDIPELTGKPYPNQNWCVPFRLQI